MKNWRPIFLLNTDAKRDSKILVQRLKSVLQSLISSNQTAYLNRGLISEGGRLLSDVLETSDSLKMKGFLLTINIEKVFDTVNHKFLQTVQENYGFNQDFLK